MKNAFIRYFEEAFKAGNNTSKAYKTINGIIVLLILISTLEVNVYQTDNREWHSYLCIGGPFSPRGPESVARFLGKGRPWPASTPRQEYALYSIILPHNAPQKPHHCP